MAAAGIASLAVIAAILGDTSLTGRGAWVIMAAVACGLSDAAMVRAVPPHTLRGVLVRAARALLASWRSRRAAPGHGPHGPKDSNGRGKEPVDHDVG